MNSIFFRKKSAENFSIKVRLKIFWYGLIDRYATSRQGLRGRLKFSRQGLMYFFQARSARNFSSKVRLKIFRQGLMHFPPLLPRRRCTNGRTFESRSGYFISGKVCSKVFNQSLVEIFRARSG
jgi:hypothetical protein